jgi:hypothetical protein
MKQFYSLFLIFAIQFSFAQINQEKYDYFVQFNGNQLSKKVDINQVLNHPIITKYISKKPDFDLRKYTSIIKLDQKITIHGSFLDSVPYYQFTIPIKGKEAVKQYLTEKLGAMLFRIWVNILFLHQKELKKHWHGMMNFW